MDEILERKYDLRRQELLEKYIKRSKRRRKRVPANTWITVDKLPADYLKRRKPPKIDDDDEIESAVSSINVNHCSSTNLADINVTNQCQENITQVTHPPLVLDDLDVAGIDDNLLLDCLLTNIDELNFILDSEDFDSTRFEQQQPQQPQQYITIDSQKQTQHHQQLNELRTTKDLDILNEIINDLNFVPETINQEFDNFLLNFKVEPPQESILSSSSPFPASMSSPSIPSTSPESQPQPEEQKMPDISPSPSQPLLSSALLSPSTSLPSSTSSSSSLPPRPSYGKDIFLLLNDATNQTESETSDDESESDD